ncbi:MAG: hypothetical protein BroJett018_22460 [Chloroflexota bacterium]|nr:hypothetical protein [Chloroflexota bacterium]NOG63194.1 hypothetical protein [Chloroflexota bacterium]GIK64452.1 MAG: hypothetical protein BroJett018_22460 [Chloroflexota bacterium]
MSDFDLALFKKQLAETIEWCVPRFSMDDLKNCLRTPPKHSTEYIDPYKYAEIEQFAKIVFEKRAKAFVGRPIENINDSLQGGRLLLFDMNMSGKEGTSSVESYDFIDGWDVPPWDTWIYIGVEKEEKKRDWPYLISWIPLEAIHLVNEAIRWNSTECIQWVQDVTYSLSFIDLLRS